MTLDEYEAQERKRILPHAIGDRVRIVIVKRLLSRPLYERNALCIYIRHHITSGDVINSTTEQRCDDRPRDTSKCIYTIISSRRSAVASTLDKMETHAAPESKWSPADRSRIGSMDNRTAYMQHDMSRDAGRCHSRSFVVPAIQLALGLIGSSTYLARPASRPASRPTGRIVDSSPTESQWRRRQSEYTKSRGIRTRRPTD